MEPALASGTSKPLTAQSSSSKAESCMGGMAHPEHKAVLRIRNSKEPKSMHKRSRSEEVRRWTPASPVGGSVSKMADELFKDFGELAADVHQGWALLKR